MHIIRHAIVASALALAAQPTLAAVFLDRGPQSTISGNQLVNQAEDKLFYLADGTTSLEPQSNILTKFTLTSGMTLNGIDIYSESYGNPAFPQNLALPIGTPVTIKIREDDSGRPADTNLVRLLSTINGSSDVFPDIVTDRHTRVHADFTDTQLAPGTYWIGMSGTNISVNWTHFFNENSGNDTYNLLGEQVNFPIGSYSAAISLHGFETAVAPPVTGTGTGTGTVPEPASWAMLIAGFGLIGSARRRQLRVLA